jgi:hypothetical protein
VTVGGDEVLLRGANVGHSDWQPDLNTAWEKRAIPQMGTAWHGTVVCRGFASTPVLDADPRYLAMLDAVVGLARAARMYVILAWRSHDINGDQPPRPDEQARQALTALATRYRGRSHVIYALQVEPHDDSGAGGTTNWAALRPLFETMVDDIRSAAAPFQPLILIPGTDWSRDISGAITDPVARPGVVYKSHPYNPSSDFQALFGTAYDAGLPVFIGEFGPKQPDDPVNVMTMDDVRALLEFTRQRRIGWAAWLLDYETYPLMQSFDDLNPTVPYGTTVQTQMVTTPPIPAAGITIDDSVTGTAPGTWSYHGTGWQHCSACDEPLVTYYNASQSWTDTPGDTAQLSFTGSRVHLFGVTAPWHGHAALSLDNGPDTLIDLYSPIKTGDTWLWSSPPLNPGTHTLTIQATGAHNPASTDTVIALDRADIDR